MAKEADATKAIAESPCILLFSDNFNIKNDAIMTIGIAKANGAQFKAIAIAQAPNPTCDNPSPIIEFLFNTKDVPSKAAQIEIEIPTIKA